jgi:hypothetical protein
LQVVALSEVACWPVSVSQKMPLSPNRKLTIPIDVARLHTNTKLLAKV